MTMNSQNFPPTLHVILIGGTSHAGKSTVARSLAELLGWEYRSTDSLARHPGRPWRNDGSAVPAHVVEHYSTLGVDELIADVLRHYEKNVMPQVEQIIGKRIADTSTNGLVLEGSALWPDFVAPLVSDRVAGLLLVGNEEMYCRRILAESRFEEKTPPQQQLISRFLERTVAFAHRLEAAASRHDLPVVRINDSEETGQLAQRCLRTSREAVGAARKI